MNILMVCTEKLPIPNIRGGAIQTYICGVASLLAMHHHLTILGRTDPDLPAEEVTVDGITHVRIDSKGLFEVYVQEVVRFLSEGGQTFDLIHIFNRPKLVPPIRQLAPHSQIVLSMHNDMFKPSKLHPQIGATVIEQTDRIITISDYIGNALCRYYPQAAPKIRTIYSGVDLTQFAPWQESESALQARESIRTEYGLTGKKVILFVGRLSRNKGPHVLVRAMSHLTHQDAVLVIVGGSWYSENAVSDYVSYLRALANRSPLPIITTGYVQINDVHRWFCAADIFVCTSIWEEPLARVHYEAMASGLPFITTARGGNPEIVTGHNGMLIQNPEDATEYARYLNEMLSDIGPTRQMGIYGRRMAEQQFTWEHVAKNILEVWDHS